MLIDYFNLKRIETLKKPIRKNGLPENKANLTDFLSNEIMSNINDKTVVVAVVFDEEMAAKSNNTTFDLDSFKATHEEADTRLVLHVINNDAEQIVVMARDTDILLLLFFHMEKIKSEVWMSMGTSKKP